MSTFALIALVVIVGALAVLGIAGAIIQASEAKGARLSGFGFSVRGDRVQFHNQPLGPLAGAEASVTAGAGPALTKKTKASLLVACPNGAFKTVEINGPAVLRQAQDFAASFNALALAQGHAQTPAAA
jgi:hypothetical protein